MQNPLMILLVLQRIALYLLLVENKIIALLSSEPARADIGLKKLASEYGSFGLWSKFAREKWKTGKSWLMLMVTALY